MVAERVVDSRASAIELAIEDHGERLPYARRAVEFIMNHDFFERYASLRDWVEKGHEGASKKRLELLEDYIETDALNCMDHYQLLEDDFEIAMEARRYLKDKGDLPLAV